MGDARSPMVINIIATWLAVVIAWAGVRWCDAGLTFVWSALLVTSPIVLVDGPVFRRRIAEQAANLSEAATIT